MNNNDYYYYYYFVINHYVIEKHKIKIMCTHTNKKTINYLF